MSDKLSFWWEYLLGVRLVELRTLDLEEFLYGLLKLFL